MEVVSDRVRLWSYGLVQNLTGVREYLFISCLTVHAYFLTCHAFPEDNLRLLWFACSEFGTKGPLQSGSKSLRSTRERFAGEKIVYS